MMNIPTLVAPLQKDGYKLDHRRQYPPNTEEVYSNFTARKSRVEGQDHVVVFGIQAFCLSFLIEEYERTFFGVPKADAVRRFARRVKNYLGTPPSTEHIEALHDLGYLPLRIKTLPEGTLCPIRVPFMTIDSTDPKFSWLTNDIETVMSAYVWGPVTSATTASRFRTVLNEFADRTVGNRDFVPFQGHDFSMRGMFGPEASMLSGMAHLLSFVGTDTIPAIDGLEHFYAADSDHELIGCSIPATEHAVMCAGGEGDEKETYRRIIQDVYPDGPVSIVSDTWDYWAVLTDILPALKEIILARPANTNGLPGKLVIRPDSGDGVEVIAGKAVPVEDIGGETLWKIHDGLVKAHKYGVTDEFFVVKKGKYYRVEIAELGNEIEDVSEVEATPELKGTIETLWDLFGGTETAKGYKLLNEHIGAILGEGVGTENLREILQRLQDKGFASTNMVFGIGSYAYQHVTRDTYGLAMKATFCVVDGQPRNIFKNPKTDTGSMKKSAKGMIQVKLEDGKIVLHDEATPAEEKDSLLVTMFEDGQMLRLYTLQEIRDRLAEHLDAPPAPDLSTVKPNGPAATGESAEPSNGDVSRDIADGLHHLDPAACS